MQQLTQPRARWTKFKLKVAQAVSRSLYDKLLDNGVSVKDFGAKGDGITDDTAAIQAAIDYAVTVRDNSATMQASVLIPDGYYLVSRTITHHPRISVMHNGTIVPDANNWDSNSDCVYNVYDDVFDVYEGGLAQYKRADRTAINGRITINAGVSDSGSILSVPAVGVKVTKGAVHIQAASIFSCRKGGIHCIGGGADIETFEICAPLDVDKHAQGLYSNSHDGQISSGVIKFYDIGVTLEGTSNVLVDVHCWGWTSKDLGGTVGRMRRGFELNGGYNKLIGCYADTVAKDDPIQPPSYLNGGIGFYNNGHNNSFVSCKTKSHASDGKDYGCGYWSTKPYATLIDCDVTDFEQIANGYYIKYSDAGSRLNSYVRGGNVGLYTLWDANRNVEVNHTGGAFTTRRVKWMVDGDFIQGTFVIDGTINTASSDYNTPLTITLPEEFDGSSGSCVLENLAAFSKITSTFQDILQIIGVVRGRELKFVMTNKQGGSQEVKLGDIKTGNFFIGGTLLLSLEPR